jgi:hypothetical protein
MATALHNNAFRSVSAHFPAFEVGTFIRVNLPLFWSKKKQNQQDTAKEHAPKSLKLTGDTFAVVQLYRKKTRDTKGGQNEIYASKTRHRLLPWALGRWFLL